MEFSNIFLILDFEGFGVLLVLFCFVLEVLGRFASRVLFPTSVRSLFFQVGGQFRSQVSGLRHTVIMYGISLTTIIIIHHNIHIDCSHAQSFNTSISQINFNLLFRENFARRLPSDRSDRLICCQS